jgi:hypothetical protein
MFQPVCTLPSRPEAATPPDQHNGKKCDLVVSRNLFCWGYDSVRRLARRFGTLEPGFLAMPNDGMPPGFQPSSISALWFLVLLRPVPACYGFVTGRLSKTLGKMGFVTMLRLATPKHTPSFSSPSSASSSPTAPTAPIRTNPHQSELIRTTNSSRLHCRHPRTPQKFFALGENVASIAPRKLGRDIPAKRSYD